MSVKINHVFLNKVDGVMPQVLRMVGEQIRADSDQFVPRLSGDLRTFVNISASGNKAEIVYDSKYAAYQWFGVGIKNYTTPGTGPEWCERAKNQYLADWEIVFANAINKELG